MEENQRLDVLCGVALVIQGGKQVFVATGVEPFCALDDGERLAAIQEAPTRSAPGDAWSYSGLGYALLGLIIERTAGRAYSDVLRDKIFEPLGLVETCSGSPPACASAAFGHHAGEPMQASDLSSLPGTGDVWSTAADLARYTSALRAGDFLSPASRRALVAPQSGLGNASYALPDVTSDSYGYGYFLGSLGGRPAAFHPGDNPGYLSFSASIPDTDTSLVVLLNDDALDLRQMVGQVVRTVLV